MRAGHRLRPRIRRARREHGLALVCALMLMLAAMVIGVAVARGASMLRAAAHNERDRDVAHAAAEAGLRDAERDVAGAPGAMPERRAHFGPGGAAAFADSCGRGVDDRGLCRATSPPAWQVLDLAAADHPARRRSRAVFTASRRSDSARAHRRGSYCSPWSGCRSLRQGREVPAAGRGTAVPEGATDMETKADTGAATAMGTKAGNMTTATMGEGARAGAAGIPAAPGTMAARTPATTPDVAQAAPRHLLPSRRRASFPPDGLAGAKSRTGPSCTRAPGRDVARTPPPDRLDRPDRADPLDPPDLRARACRWGGGRRRPGGFTLVELMIVVAIVGILGAFAYPTYAGYIVRTRRTEGQTALIEALQQEERYRLRHNTYVAYSAEEPGTEPFPLWSGVSAATSAYELDAHACPGTGLADCVEVRARPGTAHVDPRFRDPDCGVLTLDSNGRQGAASAGVRCWP